MIVFRILSSALRRRSCISGLPVLSLIRMTQSYLLQCFCRGLIPWASAKLRLFSLCCRPLCGVLLASLGIRMKTLLCCCFRWSLVWHRRIDLQFLRFIFSGESFPSVLLVMLYLELCRPEMGSRFTDTSRVISRILDVYPDCLKNALRRRTTP